MKDAGLHELQELEGRVMQSRLLDREMYSLCKLLRHELGDSWRLGRKKVSTSRLELSEKH